jgi:hypothetical protein
MSGKLSNFVAGKTATAQPQPQNPASKRDLIGSQSKIEVPRRHKQVPQKKTLSQITHSDPFAPSEYGESIKSKAQVLVEDSQVDEHGRLHFRHDNYREETQEMQLQEFKNDDDESEISQSGEDDEDNQYGRGEHDRQGLGTIQMSLDLQHALEKQRGGQIDTFAAGPGSNYPTTTTGGPDDREGYDECSSPQDYQDEHVQHSQSKHQPFQPSQLRRPQLAPHAENSTSQIDENVMHQYIAQPKTLRQNQLVARARPQGEFQPVPSKGFHHTMSVPQQSQRVPAADEHRLSTTGRVRTDFASGTQRVNPAVSFQPDDEEERLDYNCEKLKTMDYNELCSQSFDLDPSSLGAATKQQVSLTDDELQKPLVDRLALVREKGVDHQQSFFNSLPIDEWEDAGDWFLEQFGEIMRKMRDERKQKRKLAKEFEDEVFERHERVASRKRDIAEAMDSMQTNGREVLRGSTPKRSKASAITRTGR